MNYLKITNRLTRIDILLIGGLAYHPMNQMGINRKNPCVDRLLS